MTALQRHFVAIANGKYVEYPALPSAVGDAEALALVLADQHGYLSELIRDESRATIPDAADALLAAHSVAGGALILSWTGHGVIGNDGSLRLMVRGTNTDAEFGKAELLGEWAARTGAKQVLLLIDTCHSGGALVDATRLALATQLQFTDGEHSWFGMLAASQADEPSLAGALSREVHRVLSQGPRHPDLRWDRRRQFIRGDDLLQTIVHEWSETRHTPKPLSVGPAWDLVANPLYEPDAPDALVEDALRAAPHDGRRGASELPLFVGREREVDELVETARAGVPGLHVVTGPPGCGKSMLLQRVAQVLTATGAGMHAYVRLRGLSLEQAAEELARQLGASSVRSVNDVLSLARERQAHESGVRVVLDGLDEAGSAAGDIAAQLVAPLAQHALVLLGSLDTDATGDSSLFTLVGPVTSMTDLATVEGRLADIRRFVELRLEGVHPDMNPRAVAQAFVPDDAADRVSFLLARLVTSQLREQPVDTRSPGWEAALAGSVPAAFERDIASLSLVVGERAHATAARELLHALTFAYGGGFPADDVWPAVATAISPSNTRYSRDDVLRALELLARHVVAGRERDQAVYRLAHVALAEQLRAAGADSAAGRLQRVQVAETVFSLYWQWLDRELAPKAHAYLWRHAWRHLADAGDSGLAMLRRLVERDREAFLPDLAMAYESCSARASDAADVPEAVRHAEAAVDVRRGLGQPLTLALAQYRLALAHMLSGNVDDAEAAMSDASATAERIEDEDERAMMLGALLIGVAQTQLQQGQLRSAGRMATEALSQIGRSSAASGLAPIAWLVNARVSLTEQRPHEAAQFAESALATLESLDHDTRLARVDAIGTLAAAELAIAARAQPDADGIYVSAMGRASACMAAWTLANPRDEWPQLITLNVARTNILLTQAQLLDVSRGLRPLEREAMLATLTEAITELRPHVEALEDAALLLALALQLQSVLLGLDDAEAAERSRDEAIALHRRLAPKRVEARTTLGEILHGMTAQAAESVTDADQLLALIAQQEEAVELLTGVGALPSAVVTPELALQLLVGLLQRNNARTAAQSRRRELIDRLRARSATEDVSVPLASSLVEQAESLLDTRQDEARQLAREARVLVRTDEPTNMQRWLYAASTLQEASLSLVIDGHAEAAANSAAFGDVARLLDEAADQVILLPPSLPRDVLLASLEVHRALLAIRQQRFADAEGHARTALSHFDAQEAEGQHVDRSIAQLALGLALRATARPDEGDALVRLALAPAIEAAQRDPEGEPRLAAMLNTAGSDAWSWFTEQMASDPARAARLLLYRRRSGDEMSTLARELARALASASEGGPHLVDVPTLRALVRSHRAVAPDVFDKAWRYETGELPHWLRLTPSHMALVVTWCERPTWLLSKSFLVANPALLDAATDIALDELQISGAPEHIVSDHRAVLASARGGAIDEAYALLLPRDAVYRWTQSSDPIAHVGEHPELASDDTVLGWVHELSHGDARFGGFAAVLQFAKRGELHVAARLKRDVDFADVALRTAWRAPDHTRLDELVRLLRTFASGPELMRLADVGAVIAHACAGQEESALDSARRLAAACPLDARAPLYAALGDAMQYHPEAAELLGRCTAAIAQVPFSDQE